MEIHEALEAALHAVEEVNGTDLVLTIGERPMVRLDGAIRPVEGLRQVDESLMDDYLADLLGGDRTALERDRDVDFAFSHGHNRFRGNVFFQRGMPAVALRLIQSTIPTFDEIGLPPAVQDLIHLKQGLVLFCGPTGSGKSTSMATLVDAINLDTSVPHHHDRRPDRVPAREPSCGRAPTRSRHRRAVVRPRTSCCLARRP